MVYEGWRGPKSLFARRNPGRAPCVLMEADLMWSTSSALAGDAVEFGEDPGREFAASMSCGRWKSRWGATAAAPFMSAGAGAWEASGFGWVRPLAAGKSLADLMAKVGDFASQESGPLDRYR